MEQQTMNSIYINNDRPKEFSMHHLTMTKNKFNRYGALVIFCASMLMSSIASVQGEEYSGPPDADTTTEGFPIVYSGVAMTLGAHATVSGSIQSVAAVTLGAAAEVSDSILAGAAVTVERDGTVGGDVTAGAAVTLGASVSVGGDVAARAEVTIGDSSEISGNVTGSRNITLGNTAKIFGNTTAANSVTLGAYAEAGTDPAEGTVVEPNYVRAMSGPIILGALAKVNGNATAGSIVSMGVGAVVSGASGTAGPVPFDNKAEEPVAEMTDYLTTYHEALSLWEPEPGNELATTIATSRAFAPGVYHASALTTAAGVTLTFTGTEGNDPAHWLINIDTYLSIGANVTIELVNVAEGSTIIFNAGTYTTIGADSTLRGTIVTGTYITTGANSTLAGVGSHAGGLYAINGAITIGAYGKVEAVEVGSTDPIHAATKQATPQANMVWIKEGSFEMGNPDSEVGRSGNEGPRTSVTISRGFWMGIHEVTQAQYKAVIGSNPSSFSDDTSHPVERVSWNNAVAYCTALTTSERVAGNCPEDWSYRLPTEAEWEYACRAGTATRFSYGDDLDYTLLTNYAWYGGNGGNSEDKTHPVGQKVPNSWGLYDMHGNVWEWCQDSWDGSNNYPGGSTTDPLVTTGLNRVFRGGAWSSFAGHARCANRNYILPRFAYSGRGFRVVLAPGQP
jgi:formylglycine-generating enzyme required for sulfatase activity